MKTRNGFVSNSSSQSFVVHGILVSKEEVLSKLPVSFDEEHPYYSGLIEDAITKKCPNIKCGWRGNINAFSYLNWFRASDGEKPTHFIIGKQMDEPKDGDWVGASITPQENEKIREQLSEILDMPSEKIQTQTFFQYVSNDNY
jgi:hypothetical protein